MVTAVAQGQSLAWELPHAVGMAKKCVCVCVCVILSFKTQIDFGRSYGLHLDLGTENSFPSPKLTTVQSISSESFSSIVDCSVN